MVTMTDAITLVIPAFSELREEIPGSKLALGYIASHCFKIYILVRIH
jgi:hypothetical protein